jgi:hypothetical protein
MPSRTSLLSVSAVVLAAIAAARWRSAVAPPRVADSMTKLSWEALPALSGDSIADASEMIVSNDPFRLSNEAPTVRYNPANDGAGGLAAAIPLVRPSLTLKAIVGGPPWQAVIEGLPGQQSGAVAEVGTRFDRIVIRSISRDSVVVQAPDTLWVLRFKRGS